MHIPVCGNALYLVVGDLLLKAVLERRFQEFLPPSYSNINNLKSRQVPVPMICPANARDFKGKSFHCWSFLK